MWGEAPAHAWTGCKAGAEEPKTHFYNLTKQTFIKTIPARIIHEIEEDI